MTSYTFIPRAEDCGRSKQILSLSFYRLLGYEEMLDKALIYFGGAESGFSGTGIG